MLFEVVTYLFTSLYEWIHNAITTFRFHHLFQYFFYISVILYCWRTLIQIIEHLFPPKPDIHTKHTQIPNDPKGEWIDDEEDEDEMKNGLKQRKKQPPTLPPRTHPKHKIGTPTHPTTPRSTSTDPAVTGTLTLLRTHIIDVITYHEYYMKHFGPGTLFINVDTATGPTSHCIIKQWQTCETPSDWEAPPLYLNAERVLRTGDDMAISMLKSYDPTCEMIWILYRTEKDTHIPQQTWSYRISYDKQEKKIKNETDTVTVPI